MPLYLERNVPIGPDAVVRHQSRLIDGLFEGTWTLEEAIWESRKDVFKDSVDRLFSLRVLPH
jgi:hypothetical protein